MKIKLLLSALLLLSYNITLAQWPNQATSPWVNNFTGVTNLRVNATSIACDDTSTSRSPFLPAPPSGESRVYMPASSGGVFTLNKDANTLVVVPSLSLTIPKFSVYTMLVEHVL